MISSPFIKTLFFAFLLVFFQVPSFGQITDPLRRAAEKTLRKKINELRPDTNKVEAELNLAKLYLCAGFNKRSILDSSQSLNLRAEVLSRQLNSVKWLKEVLKSKAAYYFEIGNSRKGEECVMEIISSSGTSPDSLAKAFAWLKTGRSIPPWSKELYSGKILCFNHAIKLFTAVNHKMDVITAFKSIAEAHLNQGKLDLAKKELFQVLNQYKAIHFKKLFGTYDLISQLYRFKGDMHQALYFGLETIKNMEATGDYTDDDLYYLRISNTYEDLGMYDEAIFYNKKILNGKNEDQTNKVVAVKHIVSLLIKKNKKNEAFELLKLKIKAFPKPDYISKVNLYQTLATCYLSLGLYKQADIYIDNMIIAAGDYHYLLGGPVKANLSVYNLACSSFLTTKHFRQGKYYLQQLQAIPKAFITPVLRSNMELYQSKIDSAEGNHLLALKHFQAYKYLSDSLFNNTKSNQIEELQISYESRQKDADLALLNKKSQVQQASITNKNLVTKFIIIGFVSIAIVFAVIIAGLYNRFLVNKRYNSVLEGTQREIAAKNTFLEKLLADNEWLLREIHHRVKNNLHVIMGLLQSQSAYLEDGIALNAVRDSRNRVQSMALIHQKLYMTPSAADIYMPEFVTELVDNLKDSFDTGLNIYFHLEAAPITMDANYVVPVGLILNEAITNAIKHAFPHSDQDTIKISLASTDMGEVTITIADNGKGINPNADVSKSFGMQLISGLVRELGGELSIDGPPGTTLLITFKTVHATKPS